MKTARLLCLVFAGFVATGLVVSNVLAHPALEPNAQALLSLALLFTIWIVGYVKGQFSPWLLPAELVLFTVLLRHDGAEVSAAAVTYVAMQFRLLYGKRREGWVTAAFYIAAFLGTHGLRALEQPLTIVRVLALLFASYLITTLALVLNRDREQVQELDRQRRTIKDSEERFRSVAESLREALIVTDLNDKVTYANERVHSVLGYAVEDVRGKNAALLFTPSQRPTLVDKLRDRMDGQAERYETELIRADGSHVVAELSAAPFCDASGNVVGTLALISDVSERKHLKDMLRQAQRLEAVGQLAGGIAHDFNNLLTVMKCHTELLLADEQQNHETREAIAEIDRAADRAASLTRQLLAFSRRQLLQPKRVTLDEVVAQTAPLLHRIIGSRVELQTRHLGESMPVFVDPLQVEHVLVVLIRNATEAMPGGGRIIVETRVLDLMYAFTSDDHRNIPPGRYAVLSVADSGRGMDAATQKRIFEPFFTTKRPGEGSGLGLASVYGIVKQSGGFIDVQSAPGAGSTFRIYLPLTESGTAILAETTELQTA